MKKTLSILVISISLLMTYLMNASANTERASAEDKHGIKTIKVNNYPIAYIEQGQGEPLLLIHGSLSDYRTWQPLMNELSESHRVIAVSLRHCYPEKWDGKGGKLGLEQDARDMAAFIRELKLGKVDLIGHSRGGAVALLLASKHPGLVKKLVIADPAPMVSMLQGQHEALDSMKKRKTMLQTIMQDYASGKIDAGLKVFVTYIAGKNAWGKTTETRRNALRQNALTLKSLIRDAEVPFNCQDVKKITAPVMIVTGEYSKPIYGQMNKAVSSCLKEPMKATVADAGHMMYSANPTAFTFEIMDFIATE